MRKMNVAKAIAAPVTPQIETTAVLSRSGCPHIFSEMRFAAFMLQSVTLLKGASLG